MLIALFLHDGFVRPYVGDVLVVMLMYCFVRTFFRTPVFLTALAVLVFSFIVEMAQYYGLVYRLGLEHSAVARTVIGIGYDRADLVAYLIGFAFILLIERLAGDRISRPAGDGRTGHP